jgi:uncharacterized protein involved in propanediol utilization
MQREPSDTLSTASGDYSSQLSTEITVKPLSAGCGTATAHHGEIFQGVLEVSEGRLKRGLVSLPCGIFRSEATFFPDKSGIVRVEPVWKIKTRKAVELALSYCGKRHWGGVLKICSTIPVGWGLGSSTSDVTAAIRAVADAFGVRIEARIIASLAVQAESASDSTMFNENLVLFAQREGVIIEDLKGSLPALEVLGFNTDLSARGIDTLSFLPVRYSWWEVEAFRPLVGLLRRAIDTQNPHLIGHVATASAHINQRHMPKPHYDFLKQVVHEVGALGLQVAHSGTVVGFLFDPADSQNESRIQGARRMISEMGFDETWRFKTRATGYTNL